MLRTDAVSVIRCLVIGWMLATAALHAQTPTSEDNYENAVEAFQQGRVADAEQLLRAGLKAQPRDARTLDLLGVVLDAQKRYDEALRSYQQALALAPRSASLLNNLGNHYLAQGDLDQARAAFLKAVALDPSLSNANLHLAQMSLAEKEGNKALHYVDRLPKEEQEQSEVQLLRAQALELSGQHEAARDTLAQLESRFSGDPRLAFSVGLMYVDWKLYAEAERAFAHTLNAAPGNFDVLYNLGLAAMRAGHLDRAQEVFETALQQRSSDVDCLAGLAWVLTKKGEDSKATEILVQAERLAPDRPDILLALAHTTEKLGFYGDSAAAYDRYLKLRPDDDVARRERGFGLARSGNPKAGAEDLEWYVLKHPQDPIGLYELAIVESVGEEREKALSLLNRALTLDAQLIPARFARGRLYCEERKAAECIDDLSVILKQEPENAQVLDQLGQAYMMLDQSQDALKVLERAIGLAPNDRAMLMHYSQALRRSGHHEEALAVLDRFRKAAADEQWRPRAGLLDYLSLAPAERQARYRANLESIVAGKPDDVSARLQLGRFLLAEGKTREGSQIIAGIRGLSPNSGILAKCGETLIQHGLYEEAVGFLRGAVAAEPVASDVRLNLILAVFHASGPEPALSELEAVPARERNGDYFLLKAQILDSLGKIEEAAETLNQGFRAAPTRPDLYLQAALFLLKHSKYRECLALLQQATRIVPDARELLLVQAVTHRILSQLTEADRLLEEIQSRWPEWDLAYLVHGIVLETLHQSGKARVQLQTAIALGCDDPAAYYYLALATVHAAPQETEAVRHLVSGLLESQPRDPYVQWLAGSDALSRKDYHAAIEHLTAAIRILPDLAEAHYSLGTVYRNLGDLQKSNAEMQEFQRLSKASRQTEPTAPLVRDLLFSVGQMAQVANKAPQGTQ